MRLAACLVAFSFALATPAWALLPCPSAGRTVTLSGSLVGTFYGTSPTQHSLQMHPCEEFWVDVQSSSTDPWLNNNLYVAVKNISGTNLAYKSWPMNYYATPSVSEMEALPVASTGFPLPGTRLQSSLVAQIDIWSDYARPSYLQTYTLTVHFNPRPGYNLGGLAFTDAFGPLANGTVLHASMRSSEVNYYRVSIQAGGTLTLSGSLVNENWSLGIAMLMRVFNMAQQPQATLYSQTVPANSSHDPNGVSLPFTSSTFTNTTAQTQDYYIVIENSYGAILQDSTINIAGNLVPPPELTLFLDVDGNFSTTAPSSDHLTYVPGADLSGVSVSLPQNLQLIAAYVNGNGQIVAPPAWASPITYALANTSAFLGKAMNWGDETTPDFQLGGSQVSFGVDNTARVALTCDDYGGFTTASATDGAFGTASFRLPVDGNGNWLPSAGWLTHNGTVADQGDAGDDEDPSYPAQNLYIGDGLSAFEEFRGFMVSGVHKRTSPAEQDVFAHSEFLVEGLGDAWDLQVTLHEIDAAEMDSSRRITPNYTNSGAGGDIPGHFWGTLANNQQREQLAIKVTKDTTTSSLPSSNTPVAITNGQIVNGDARPGPPWTIGSLASIVYTLRIRKISPNHNNTTDIDPYDTDKTHQTIAHEIGHNVGLDDADYSALACPPYYADTVMASSYFSQTTSLSDCAWTHIPHGYRQADYVLLQVR